LIGQGWLKVLSMVRSATRQLPGASDERRLIELSAAIAFAAVVNGLVLCAAISGRFLLRPANVNYVTPRLIDAFRMGDAHWYEDIAEKGYSWSGDPEERANLAFFPVYPLAARAVSRVTGAAEIGALMLLSNTAFTAACALLWVYLVRRDPAATLPWHALLAMSVFPTGCFFRLPYSESLFLLLAIGALYLMQRHASLPLICALVGLATATRAVGVALVFSLALFILNRPRGLMARVGTLCWALPLSCWGLAAFAWFQFTTFGDALAFVKVQAGWRLQPTADAWDKWMAIGTGRAIWTVYDPASPVYWAKRDPHGIAPLSLHFANPLLFLLAIGLIVVGARRRWLTRYEVAFSAAALAIPYLARAHEMGMGSMGRFVAAVFPIYIVVGHLLSRAAPPIRAAIVCVMVCLLVSYAALFSAGYGIY
jgi:hypothetical protein